MAFLKNLIAKPITDRIYRSPSLSNLLLKGYLANLNLLLSLPTRTQPTAQV